ncbi:helix-turn-helix domain-containing protein [Bacillus paranthracis]|uniref:helix-turn-helix domain-containing protein n=1 Tax=Bacillus paranthracis TaxID=2026186 RepID=UPI0013D0DB8D|nr:helix-turn-helix transcriptional regulator [Bacillus paranthracis]MDK7447159.1 helix-turn-helix transcriptional regulator [Bacillus paranthracis]MDN8630393.1 helix-turn-helix transcriptional regulator [Bacillus paranthracis]MDN8638502.1 helix-turn-helix transcriptional regulator [Bacillus paranthracis]HDR7852000.1 helix-turn-helix transcriptional regulator [Bacillus paranthracis]
MKEKAYQSKPLLTKREREVFELLVQDKTTKEIAGELFISEKTVRNHISNVMCRDCKKIIVFDACFHNLS